MAARAIGASRLDVLVMAIETRSVTARFILEECGERREIVADRITQRVQRSRRNTICEFWHLGRRLMTYRTVIELWFVVDRTHLETRRHKMSDCDIAFVHLRCDQILMDVMRKDGRKFPGPRRDRKRKTLSGTGARANMTGGADRRAVSTKKIAAVATDARCVTRIIRNIGIAPRRDPVRRWNFMTRGAVDAFMLAGPVRKFCASSLRD